MPHTKPKIENGEISANVQPLEETPAASSEQSTGQTRAVRYMDDDTFRQSLEEVVTVHDRLLAKLAE